MYRTAVVWVSERDEEIMAMQEKRKSSRRRSHPSTDRWEPLDGTGQVSFDSTELDVVIVDGARRQQHRPLLILVTDVATRQIVRCDLQMTNGLPPYLKAIAPRRS